MTVFQRPWNRQAVEGETTHAESAERLDAFREIVAAQGSTASIMAIVGFNLWRGADDEIRVTVPARPFGVGSERRFFDMLRSDGEGSACVKAVKQAIIQAWKERQ